MKTVSFIIPHFKTWKWTAICIERLLRYGIPSPIEQEIIVVDNSPGHPSIKAITDTELGRDIRVRVISGDPHFTSHGMGYDIGVRASKGDWIFTVETDSFPIRCGWFDEFVKLSAEFDLIGPEIPQGAGRYIHPAGALLNRKVYDAAVEWQIKHKDWYFVPGAGLDFGYDKPYHVVMHESHPKNMPPGATCAHVVGSSAFGESIAQWLKVGPFQEMMAFEDDDWNTYPQRTGITHFEPDGAKLAYKKIGYEAGQWLAYFAEKHGFKLHRAPVDLKWMPGHHGAQASGSTCLGFHHVWCGTVSNVSGKDLNQEVTSAKLRRMTELYDELPQSLRLRINELEEKNK